MWRLRVKMAVLKVKLICLQVDWQISHRDQKKIKFMCEI